MKRVVLALDWTPNTNHSGFYVAQVKGLYAAAGLEVVIKSPEDAGGVTPARQVAAGTADLAVTPSETAISFATTGPDKPRLVAVAALLQGSASAIAVLANAGIETPRDLAGKRYASYDGRFEDRIVARMVSNDGGDGAAVQFHSLDFHGYDDPKAMGAGSVVASHLEQRRSDSTWIFPHWEGVLAERAGQKLRCFAPEDYGVPYGYSPVLLAHPDLLAAGGPTLRAFLAATAKGFQEAASDASAAAAALCACGRPSLADAEFVRASAAAVAPKYLSPQGKWGAMERPRWAAFVDFLSASGVLTDREGKAIARDAVDEAQLFTNEFLGSFSEASRKD